MWARIGLRRGGGGAPREQAAGGSSVPRRRLHGDGGGTRPGRAASVGRCGGGLELGGGWNGAEGRARARRTNGGRRWCSACAGACCGTVACSGVRAGAPGRLLWAAGQGMRGWRGPGQARGGRSARPDAAVAERPSGRDVRGLSGASATARRDACSSGGRDGAAQRGSSAAVA